MKRLSGRQDEFYWFEFYPDIWMSDPELNACSDAAQGLWMRMMCRMFRRSERGTLPGDTESLSNLLGRAPQVIDQIVGELERNEVFVRGVEVSSGLDPDAIVCKRMYREWATSRKRSEAGAAGGRISKRKAKPKKTKARPKPDHKQNSNHNPMGANNLGSDAISKTKANSKPTPKPPFNKELKLKKEGNINAESSETEDLSKAVEEIMGGLQSSDLGKLRRHYMHRIQEATQDGPEWLQWWKLTVGRLEAAGELSALEEHLGRVEQCRDPAIRKSKDLGRIETPGRFLTGKILAWARANNFKLDELPTKGGSG